MYNRFIKRLDKSIKPVMFLPIIAILAAIPAAIFLPVQFAEENHLIENSQVLILFITFMLCINSRVDKRFFNCIAFACLIIFLMEINSGEILFNTINEHKEFILASYMKDVTLKSFENIFYASISAIFFIYILFTKFLMFLPDYITKSKISFYNICFLIIGAIFQFAGIKSEIIVLEKMAETILYLAFMSIIYLQTQDDEYIEAVKD